MLIHSKRIFLIFSLTFCNVQTQTCPCLTSTPGSSWAQASDVSSSGPCSGICDLATQNRTRICEISPKSYVMCNIVSQCTVRATCEGKWAKWANSGPCSSTCGPGVRSQQRICYKRSNSSSNSRSNFCLGGKGKNETRRQSNCKSKRCKYRLTTTTTSDIFSRFTSLTTTTTSTTLLSTDSTNQTISLLNDSSTSPGSLPVSPVPRPLDQINVYTLASILGSVVIISIALIVVTIICVRRNKRRPDPTIPMNNVVISAIEKKKNAEADNYETVPPELPTRPRGLNGSVQSHTRNILVKNRLYHPTSENGSINDMSPPPYEGVYLDPDSVVNSLDRRRNKEIEEGTYVSIDEVRK